MLCLVTLTWYNTWSKIIWRPNPSLNDLFLHVCTSRLVSELHAGALELLIVQAPFQESGLGSAVERLRGFIIWNLKSPFLVRYHVGLSWSVSHIFFWHCIYRNLGAGISELLKILTQQKDRTVKTHSICWHFSWTDQSWSMPVSPQGLDLWVIADKHLRKGLITNTDKPQETAFHVVTVHGKHLFCTFRARLSCAFSCL